MDTQLMEHITARCRVKICGITSVADALMVSAAGVDAIGLVFYARSKRNISIQQAVDICAALPPFVSSVGLFLDADEVFVQDVLDAVPLDLLQFHGSESSAYCERFRRPYVKGLGMSGLSGADFRDFADQYPSAQGVLVDSHEPGAAGGTGQVFDWTQVPQDYPKAIILAGGLKADNVAAAIATTRAYAVDVSSGVEAEPGIKDSAKVTAFMDEVRRVNNLQYEAELHREDIS
jgi:phosphoribosylanthranilate isomerase